MKPVWVVCQESSSPPDLAYLYPSPPPVTRRNPDKVASGGMMYNSVFISPKIPPTISRPTFKAWVETFVIQYTVETYNKKQVLSVTKTAALIYLARH